MKKQIDFILLGLLWILAVTLGASFWFNTRFGFNIFSGTHWTYLGGIQASGATVRPIFYASIIVTLVVLVGGMYLLMLPRVRGLRLGARLRRRERRREHAANTQPSTDATTTAPATTTAADIADIHPTTAPSLARPPRLNFGINPPVRPANGPAPVAAKASIPDDTINEDIQKIFTTTGYTVKTAPRITGIKMALWAIGGGETLWMGAVGITPERMTTAMDKVKSVFHDTLDDIEIHVNAFVIGNGSDANNVHVFADVQKLGDYMAAHPAKKIPDGGQDDFNAYGEYIDTVANYLNKV